MYEPRHEKTSVFFANVQAKAQLSCAVTVLPISDCKADQRFCFRHIDSTISLLAKSEISSLELSSVGGGGSVILMYFSPGLYMFMDCCV